MQKLDRKSLDQIGKVLVKADTALTREIDEIVTNPALFDGVRGRIQKGGVEVAPKRFLTKWVVPSSAAGILVIVAVVSALVVFRSKPVEIVVQPVVDTPKVHLPKSFSRPDSVATSDFPRAAPTVRAEKISTRPSVSVNRRKQPEAQQANYGGEFYALSYAGDPNETERGGRIVRVEVPRSTLFAMGVDVPLENGPETVKADLLIGTDGVTRAIRVVK